MALRQVKRQLPLKRHQPNTFLKEASTPTGAHIEGIFKNRHAILPLNILNAEQQTIATKAPYRVQGIIEVIQNEKRSR
jgi:hypothetical protein